MRAVIIECENRFCHVLCENGEFRRIYSKASYKTGDEIVLKAERPGGNRRKRIKVISAIAACFVVMSVGYAFGDTWDREAYSLYIDINPSVKLEINSYDQVISRQSINADGIQLLNEANPKGPVIPAIVDLVTSANEAGNIGESGVVIAMSGGDSAKFAQFERLVDEYLPNIQFRFTYMSKQEAAEALSLGVTPFKYTLAKKASEICPTLSFKRACRLPAYFLDDLISGKTLWSE